MKKIIVKPIVPRGRYRGYGRDRLQWLIRRGRDYQLVLIPSPKKGELNPLASHRGARTSLNVRHR